MARTRFLATMFLAAMTWAGCQGEVGLDHGGPGGPPGRTPGGRIACPVDPDCALNPDPDACTECPDYWICQDNGLGKRCVNPGPDTPGGGVEWSCADENGRTVCTGSDFPAGGGGGEWLCESRAEGVVCTSNSPDYPEGQGGGPWACQFTAEGRVCESTTGGPGGGGWECTNLADGRRECRQNEPDYPDSPGGGVPNCYDGSDGFTECTFPPGTPVPPDGGGGWECVDRGDGTIVCRSTTPPDYPDAGGPGEWDCAYSDEARICDSRGIPPGTPGNPPPWAPNDCPIGASRWCDDAVYCSWGRQECNPDGTWGPCTEPPVTTAGLTDRPNTQCACRFFFFNVECCEDQMDRDGDGFADCFIPGSGPEAPPGPHTPPTCEHTGDLCAYCDNDAHCGGADMCLIYQDGIAVVYEDGRAVSRPSLASFCAQDCSGGAGCPAGYTCFPVTDRTGSTVANQCVPSSGACE